VRLWDLETGQSRGAFDWGIGPLTAVVFAPDGMKAAVAGRDTIVVWDVH
jgi:hypothetical protein